MFFVRIKDLVPDRSAVFDPAVQFRLNRLIRDGARICLVSEHGPAFFSRQFGLVDPQTPMIVMDGAAIYNARENSYPWVAAMDDARLREVRETLDGLGIGYFVYTIRSNIIGVFHSGIFSEPDSEQVRRLKSSPYRYYLEKEPAVFSNVVYIKIVAENDRIEDISAAVRGVLPCEKYRMEIKGQGYDKELSGLYIYSSEAVPERAREALLDMVGKDGEKPEYREPVRKGGYKSDTDALWVISQVEKEYEPVDLLKHFRRSK